MRHETTPGALRGRQIDFSDDQDPSARHVAQGTLVSAWEEFARLEAARVGGLGRGALLAAPALSTGSANSAVAFLGRGLIPAGWRQGRGSIDPTGDNNGLAWELIEPGDSADLVPMARTIHYDGASGITFTPVGPVARVVFVPGVARSLSVSGITATITFIAGTTTYGQIEADWNASYAAKALAAITGDAGTLPATFEGGTLHLSRAVLVEYVQAGSTAVGWNGTTRVITVGLDIAGVGDSVANIKAALAASASGAQYVVQLRDLYGSTGAGDVTTAAFCQLVGGAGKAMRHATLTMAQGANKDLEFEARQFGADAIPVNIALVHSAAAEPPVVTVLQDDDSADITITAKVGTATALQLLQAIRDSLEAQDWISARLAPGSNGSGAPAAFGLTALADAGDAPALALEAGTKAATGITALTDDGFTADLPALGASHAAGSTVAVRARIGGVLHEITAAVAA